MAKDPAVLFYTQDFLVGSSFLTPLQKGHYITLLCYQQQSETGSLPESQVKQLMGKDFLKQWPDIKGKFKQDENGFFNERMRKEIDRRRLYSEKQRKKAVASWRSRGNAAASATAMPNNGNAFLETEIEIDKGVKGGMGEQGYILNWDLEKKLFLNSEQWFYKFCTEKGITKDQCFQLAKGFAADLELKEEYKTAKEMKSHFTSWFNKNKSSLLQNLSEKKNGTSAREIEEQKTRKKLGLND